MKIKVTPAYGYAHGHAEKILIAIGASSICTDPDGIVTAEVTPQQFEMFQLRGVAHRAEVLPEPAITAVLEARIKEQQAAIIGDVMASRGIIDPNPIPEALKPDTSKLETKK